MICDLVKLFILTREKGIIQVFKPSNKELLSVLKALLDQTWVSPSGFVCLHFRCEKPVMNFKNVITVIKLISSRFMIIVYSGAIV